MKKIILCVILSIFTIFSVVYANKTQDDISKNVIRLHIIANSDSEKDQEIKYKIRDEIIEYSKDKFESLKTKEDFEKVFIDQCNEIELITQKILEENGASYLASASYEKVYIPRKCYNGLSLPEGSYDGLIVRLGNAKGKNWWCVAYPPLCFTEDTCGDLTPEAIIYLKDNLSRESFSLITENGFDIEYKFKIVELCQKLKKQLTK